MSHLSRDIETALALLPEHRKKSKRSFVLTLDDILDDYRLGLELNANAFDLCMHAYRFHHPFEAFWAQFRSKSVKPKEIRDLMLMGFAALLSRNQAPVEAVVDTFVNTTKKVFGAHTAGLTNAFLREVARSRDRLRAQLSAHPEEMLGPVLAARWDRPIARSTETLAAAMGRALLVRPPATIGALGIDGAWSEMKSAHFLRQEEPRIAIDFSSVGFVRWLVPQLKGRPLGRVLDACAAPGGKIIAFALQPELRDVMASTELYATEAKFKRLTRLEQNLAKMSVRAKTALHSWGEGSPPPPALAEPFDLILADLPCTGLGTLASKPDLLLEDPAELLSSVANLQVNILRDLVGRVAPGGSLAVSLCSNDPEELERVTVELGRLLPDKKLEFWTFCGDNEGRTSQWMAAWLIRL